MTAGTKEIGAHRAPLQKKELLDDLECGAQTVACGRTGEESANGVYGLAVAPHDSANVALAELHLKDRHLAARNFSEHHVVRKLDQLANDELEKLLHKLVTSWR